MANVRSNHTHTQGSHQSTVPHLQPESAGPPPAEYWREVEAKRYHAVPKTASIQAELTHSAVALGKLHCGPGIVFDLGSGGGLSTLAFQALAASSPMTIGGPPFVIGLDTSLDMLLQAPSECAVGGMQLPSLLPHETAENNTSVLCDTSGQVHVASGVRWRKCRSDLVLADLAQPLPFRGQVADSVLSISAVQWLLDDRPEDLKEQRAESVTGDGEHAQSKCGKDELPNSLTQLRELPMVGPQTRLHRLFHCLRKVIVPHGRIAMQFYPPKGDNDFGARALVEVARAEGFAADVILDFPHKTPAKKWILVANLLPASTNAIQTDPCHQPRLWCALCWPVVAAHCALQHCAESRTESISSAVHARVRHQHMEVALRLARCGRRLSAAGTTIEDGGNASDIRRRLEKELHPLQRELAYALVGILDDPQHDLSSNENPRSEGNNSSCVEASRQAAPANCESQRVPIAQTKTQLRQVIADRFECVLAVLHSAPDVRWTIPPPPLDMLAAEELSF